MFSRITITKSTGSYWDNIDRLKQEIQTADAIVIGAGSGLSTSAGFNFAGERFNTYFSDFANRFGIKDMYSGGFYPFPTRGLYWGFTSRLFWLNRYTPSTNSVYTDLLQLVKDKNYFAITTNVDHQFQKAGFDKKRLFYTQGDFGLFQCKKPCHKDTYDNEAVIRKMIEYQGFLIAEDGSLSCPNDRALRMEIPNELFPLCPKCGGEMDGNLRCDNTFVEDAGWHIAANRYEDFLLTHQNEKLLYMEFGVGMNTPGIIKYPFLRMTMNNPNATYACINKGEAFTVEAIIDRSICINEDIQTVLSDLKNK